MYTISIIKIKNYNYMNISYLFICARDFEMFLLLDNDHIMLVETLCIICIYFI